MICNKDNIRIDIYLSEELDLSRSKVQKLIKDNKILVNGNPINNSYKTKLDDEIEVLSDLDYTITIEGEDIPLDIRYEDDYY